MKRFYTVCLSLLMVLSLLSPAKAGETGQQTETTGQAERVRELTEYRTKTSETFLLSDGTEECVVYTENKYYEDAQGKHHG